MLRAAFSSRDRILNGGEKLTKLNRQSRLLTRDGAVFCWPPLPPDQGHGGSAACPCRHQDTEMRPGQVPGSRPGQLFTQHHVRVFGEKRRTPWRQNPSWTPAEKIQKNKSASQSWTGLNMQANYLIDTEGFFQSCGNFLCKCGSGPRVRASWSCFAGRNDSRINPSTLISLLPR